MKTLISTLYCTLVLFGMNAQPVISDSWIPKVGDTWQAAITFDTPDAGDSGANVTWDFSDLNIDNFYFQILFNWIDPAVTEYADSFPDATVCADFEGFALGYYRSDDSKFEYLGSGSQFGIEVFTNPQSFDYIGLDFEETVVDSYEYVSYNDYTDPETAEGWTSYTYDAYGTLVLPNVTISDAIRIYSIDVEADSSENGPLTTVRLDSVVTHAWIADGSVFPVAQRQTTISYSKLYINGELFSEEIEGPDTTFSINPDYGLISSLVQITSLPELDLFPTVVRDEVNVRIESQSLLDYSIYALNGATMGAGLTIGEVTQIDISEFSPGYYVIKVDGFAPDVFLKME